MARIMGLDLGKARTGVAISDPTQTNVSPVTTINIKNEMIDGSSKRIFNYIRLLIPAAKK